MINLQSLHLRELCTGIFDCPHSTPRWTSSGKLVIRNFNVKNGRLNLSFPSYTDDENFYERCKRAKPMPGDIIITREAPMGKVCMIPYGIECCLGQRMVLLRPNPSMCDSSFLMYAMMSQSVQHQISWSNGTGTTISNLRIPHLERLAIPYFEIKQQRNIAATLSCLDDKIELNNKINANLEAQAQAVFKSWFVDFEPFQDGEFVASELGRIPKGWRVVPFTELVDVLGGGTPKTDVPEYWNGEIPFFTPKDVSDVYTISTQKTLTQHGIKNCNSRLYPQNTVFITARGTVGKVALAGNSMAMNQSCYALQSKLPYSQYFIYQITLGVVDALKNKATGAVFDAIVTRDFENEMVVLPDVDIVRKYTFTVEPMFKLILKNLDESKTLSLCRDSLLPKIMSGEIEISNTEAIE